MYYCDSHASCGAQLRIIYNKFTRKWVIEENEIAHSRHEVVDEKDFDTKVPQHIKAKMLPYINDFSPKKIIKKCMTDEEERQIVDRKRFRKAISDWKKCLLRKKKGPLAMESFADVAEWARKRLHLRPVAKEGDDDVHALEREAFVVLGVEDENGIVVFSTPGLLTNLRMAELADVDLYLVADGTHKIHYGGFVFLTLGTYSIQYLNGGLVHSFRPISFAMGPTESNCSCSALLKCTLQAHARIYGHMPEVKATITDRGGGLRSAIREQLPDAKVRNSTGLSHVSGSRHLPEIAKEIVGVVQIVGCWVHVVQMFQHKKLPRGQRISDVANWGMLEQGVKVIHKSRSVAQATEIGLRVMRIWQTAGETRLAEWFRTNYLAEGKLDWTVCSAPFVGMPCHIASQESWHKHAKAVFVRLRRPTDLLFNHDLPDFLFEQTQEFSGRPLSPDFARELSDDVHGALDYMDMPGSYLEHEGDLYVNKSPFERENLGSVTERRVRIYKRSLEGELLSGPIYTLHNLKRKYLSLYRVQSLTTASPTCDCKHFQSFGFCRHVLLSRALNSAAEENRLRNLAQCFGPRPPPNRPRNATAALQRQPPDEQPGAGSRPQGRGRGRGGTERGRGRGGRHRGRGRS